jgi:hypothetical protein
MALVLRHGERNQTTRWLATYRFIEGNFWAGIFYGAANVGLLQLEAMPEAAFFASP